MFLGEKLRQDNAPAHNLILSKTVFSENGLEILENWSPNLPDIKIIEIGVCLRKEFSKEIRKILRNFGHFVKKTSKEYLWSTFKTYTAQFQID